MSSKSLMVMKICFLSLIAIVLLGVMIFFLVFRGSIDKIERFFNNNRDYKLVYSKEYDINQFSTLKFDLINADLDIEYSNTDTIKLEIYDKDETKFNVNADNSILDVSFNKFSAFCIGFCYSDRKVILYLPSSYSGNMNIVSASGEVEISSYLESVISVSTASGDVNVMGARELEANTASGDVSVRNVPQIKVKTISGDIDILDASNINGSTTSGEVEIKRLNGSINFECISGDVDMEATTINANSKISTVSGDVDIEGINPVYINTSTISGDVDIYNNDRKSDIELSIKTTSGDIEVR